MSEPPDIRHAQSAVVWLRVVSSLAWLDSALIGKDSKLAADFRSGAELVMDVNTHFVRSTIVPGIVSFLQDVVVPHAHAFALLVGVTDLVIGILLLFGLFTKLGCALGIGRSIWNILIAGGASFDVIGFNSMLILAAIIVIATGAGRRYSIDRFLLKRWPSSRVLRLVA
ncbi:MAG: TQO small subunit DoxD [Acidobacteriaceae bacterium]